MLKLPAVLTHQEARSSLAALVGALRQEPAGDVVVDAGELVRFDSSALAVLLECRRVAREQGRNFGVRGSNGRLRRLADLYGVEVLLRWVD